MGDKRKKFRKVTKYPHLRSEGLRRTAEAERRAQDAYRAIERAYKELLRKQSEGRV